ncbi:MAG: outer membrane beta-barrel protein [Bacteroidia bacterium]|nr:outer membrane beta-barrel protein [Bacteroidia bacterium]
MKANRKLVLGSLLLTVAFAQKPTAGTVTSEVALRGAINNVNIGLVQGARVRYFLGDNLAVRLGLSLDTRSKVEKDYENPDGTGAVGEEKHRYSEFGILPGVEYHFAGGEKLSTFAGAYLLFALSGARTERTNYSAGGYTPNFSQTVDGSSDFGNKGTSIGLGLYSGFDWYFTEKIYLGVEWGLLFQRVSTSDVVIETSSGGITTKVTQAGGSQGGILTSAISALRLGYQF